MFVGPVMVVARLCVDEGRTCTFSAAAHECEMNSNAKQVCVCRRSCLLTPVETCKRPSLENDFTDITRTVTVVFDASRSRAFELSEQGDDMRYDELGVIFRSMTENKVPGFCFCGEEKFDGDCCLCFLLLLS